MLNGSLSSSEEDEVAHILDLNESNDYRVVTFMIHSKEGEGQFNDAYVKETEIAERYILRALTGEHIFYNTNQIIYIHKIDENDDKLKFIKQVEQLQRDVQKHLLSKGIEVEFLAGIGKTVTGYHSLKDSFSDSKLAIRYIDVVRRIVGDQEKAVVDFSKLGFFGMVGKMMDKAQLLEYIPESVKMLYKYDKQKNAELTGTLECFLNNNQSLKKTATDLFIHYRTVSYRLKRIEEVTGMDFNNVAEMLAVRNGLIMSRLLELL